MHGTARVASLAALCVGALATPLRAQNLLANPDFDTSLEGWTIPGVAWLASSFDATDWAGMPDSGSLRVVNTVVGSDSAGPFQCVPIPEADGATAYDMRAQARVADGNFLAGTAELGLWYYETSECGGINWGNNLLLWGGEEWPMVGELGLHDFVVPAATRSILFELRAHKYAESESFEARFDHVYLPECSALASTCAAWLALARLPRLGSRRTRSRAGATRRAEISRAYG